LFENLNHFDRSAQRALRLALEEAHALGNRRLDSDHVLLALVRDPASPTSRVLESLDVAPRTLREAILASSPARPHRTRGELPVAPRFKQLLRAALRESVRCRARSVTTTHLLVALAEDDTSLAGQMLAAAGANPRNLHDQAAGEQCEATIAPQHEDIRSPAKNAGASSPRAADPEPGSRPRPQPRVRRLLARLVKAGLLLQLLVFSVLTLAGWGSLPSRDADPPRMERMGPPPALIETYASLSNITFPLEHRSQRQIATAVFVGTPADWGGPEPAPPSLDVLGQPIGTSIRQLGAGTENTILFVVPSAALYGPLYVVIKGARYRLTVLSNESPLGFAVVSATVENQLLSAFDSSLLWLNLPVPRPTSVPLMLIRREPGKQAYLLTHGTLGAGSHTGVIASPVDGVTLGSPVIAITSTASALAGFLEQPAQGSSRYLATSVVANALNAIGPSVSSGS
jgi:Clp amino terminal domain, pathogenicity island component